MNYKGDEHYDIETHIQNNSNYMSQHEVAIALGISRSQVDTLEKKALRKLKFIVSQKYKREDLV